MCHRRGSRAIAFAILALLVALAGISAFSQSPEAVFSGTILLWTTLDNRVMVVADSRASKQVGHVIVSAGDESCKIIAPSKDSLFFYGGLMEVRATGDLSDLSFSASKLAISSYREIAQKPRSLGRLKQWAELWDSMIRPKLNEVFKIRPTNVVEPILGGFGGLDSRGNPILLFASVGENYQDGHVINTLPSRIERWPPDSNTQTGYASPADAELSEFFANGTLRSRLANNAFAEKAKGIPQRDLEPEHLIAAVESAIAWDASNPGIGGPVDAAVIEPKSGVRWIRRKKQCYKRDNLN